MWKEVFDVLDKEIDRDVIKEGASNLIMGFESVGWKLFLTKDTLLFYSHNINSKLKRHAVPIPLDDIFKVEKCSTLGLVPNGIKIITAEKNYKFVVFKRKEWINEIKKLKQ